MLPQVLNNKAFISYECKAKYILEEINIETDFKEIFFIIEHIVSYNKKAYTVEDYISRLFYINSMCNNNIQSNDYMKSIDIIKTMLLQYVIMQKRHEFTKSLLEEYGIYFKDIKFVDYKSIVYGYIDNDKPIKLNIGLGHILVTYYKNLIYKDNFINSIIDKLGDIIERREYIGNVNSRL